MPQLDFFTFSHQFLILSILFSGLYYFNLLILFPKIRWFEIEKFFFFKFIAFDIYYINRWTLGVVTLILNVYRISIHEYVPLTYLLTNKIIFSNVGFTKTKNVNSKNLFIFTLVNFLFLLFFLKNILIFNAEKLMFIYFILVMFILFNFIKFFISDLLISDIKVLIDSLIKLENKSNLYLY